MRIFFILAALIFLETSVVYSNAQEILIRKVTPKLIKVPEYQYSEGPPVVSQNINCRPLPFLALETEFTYQPSKKNGASRYIDGLQFTYYFLLNQQSRQHPHGILLTGSVIHDAICAGKEKRSVMYVAPSTLERFLGENSFSSVTQCVQDFGVTIHRENQLISFKSWKGQGLWWKNYQPLSGFVLNKNQTPFALLQWNEYEQIRSVSETWP